MDFQKINAWLVVVGGTISSIGSAIGFWLGGALGTPRDACGWQYVQPTLTAAQLHALVQGTAVPLLNERVRVFLGECSGPDPWMLAALGAIPGVLIFFAPLFKKS